MGALLSRGEKTWYSPMRYLETMARKAMQYGDVGRQSALSPFAYRYGIYAVPVLDLPSMSGMYRTPSPPRDAYEPITPPKAPVVPTPIAPRVLEAPPPLPVPLAPEPVATQPPKDKPATQSKPLSDYRTDTIEKILEGLRASNIKSSELQKRMPRKKDNDYLPKDTVPIRMARDKTRFTVLEGFLEANVTHPVW